MVEKFLLVHSAFGELNFVYPDEAHMDLMLRNILSGRDYPWPNFPESYVLDTVVDIGANVGASALWFLTQKPRRIVCFEPSSRNAVLLVRNLAIFPQAEVYAEGLFGFDTKKELYYGHNNCMEHSIISSARTQLNTETITLRRASTRLAELNISRISVLKIDTEGCEIPILIDLIPLLPKIDLLYIEYHSEEDRRYIDVLMASMFTLVSSHADTPHRGTNLYMSKNLVECIPRYANLSIRCFS